MEKLLIIKAGTTYPSVREKAGDFDDMVIARAELQRKDVAVYPVYQGQKLPDPGGFGAVIITGSHDMVTDRALWSLDLADWIKRKAFGAVPLMAICFGHQLAAMALGGSAGYHPQGVEMGTVRIEVNDAGREDPLLQGLPAGFAVQAAHAQTVTALPPGAKVLAGNSFEQHHAVAYGRNAWGLQFHPEFTADIVRMYIEEARAGLEKKGLDTSAMLAGIEESPCGELILKRFIELACG